MAHFGDRVLKLASSHLITSCATFAAILLFVVLGSQVIPTAIGATEVPQKNGLAVAFILNIAIIIFGWHRSKDLKLALTAHQQAERAAHEAAYADFTTGLANRRHFMRTLEQVLGGDATGTVALLDLDDFKKVNDLHGHVAGDQLLKSIGAILVETAPEGSCCARTGGDEFAILLPTLDRDEVEEVARAVCDKVARMVQVEQFAVRISASVGLLRLNRSMSATDALRHSDVAMYSAKRAGKSRFSWYDCELEREVLERAQLEVDIRTGIENGEFVPYFQPLVQLSTGELGGFEVLARWKSPKRGLLEPKEFISLAEGNGSIAELSLSVMEQALAVAKNWPAHLKLAVNVSPLQFRDPQLAHRIVQILTRTGFPAQRLELEITESSLLEDPKLVTSTVASLKNLGITISLDDFGTGYASLSQLRALPFDRIKIDQSFISALMHDQQSAAIVKTISSLGKSLSLRVTAEGVETEGVRSRLTDLGCTDAQGYLFGTAVSATEAVQFLSDDWAGGRAKPNTPAGELPDLRRAANL